MNVDVAVYIENAEWFLSQNYLVSKYYYPVMKLNLMVTNMSEYLAFLMEIA